MQTIQQDSDFILDVKIAVINAKLIFCYSAIAVLKAILFVWQVTNQGR